MRSNDRQGRNVPVKPRGRWPGHVQRVVITGLLAALGPVASCTRAPDPSRSPQPAPILEYIQETWRTLTRSDSELALAAVDPKFEPLPSGKWPVYVSRTEDLPQITSRLAEQMALAAFNEIELRQLPENAAGLREHGLLYLPWPYVVPGGRFNEMYGWDSYFIQVGLLSDNEITLAQNMVDNFLYQIRHYGKILNANRTYYLTRSQPPFLTQMLLGLYEQTNDRAWLQEAVPAIEQYHRYWTAVPHLTPETGLSRYFDLGEGPAPEVVASERDEQGRTHYDRVREYFRTHEIDDYDVTQYYGREDDQLTPLFYQGDRAMRESGFDPSNRFGPFSIDIIHYNPVCLNSLLYLMESQTAEILRILDRDAEAQTWEQRARDRASRINQLMWSEEDGLYYDYNFVGKQQRRYPFLTTFYPLWAGFATPDQAARVAANLPLFEQPGGLQTSTEVTGSQWDAPFGWGPLHMIAVEGLRRYGYNEEADRVALKFLSLVRDEYREHGTIVEKYNVVQRTSRLSNIRFGYQSNEVGFGWTNAAFTSLLDTLAPSKQEQVLIPEETAVAVDQ